MSEMRFTTGAKESPMSDLVVRSLMETGGWSIESFRAPGFRLMQSVIDSDGFRAAAPLPDRAQVVLDNAVVSVGMQRLTVAADIMAAGLTYNLPDPLSVTQLEHYLSNKAGNAYRAMSPSARGENFLPDMLPARLPVYLTMSKFELDIRTLRMSQRLGLPLDTANIESGTRMVNEAVEDALINGATTLDGQDLKVGGYGAPGLVNAPNAETQALTLASWDSTPVAATIFSEVNLMLGKLRANKKYGPYGMYVNTEVGAVLDNDYVVAAPQNTIRERLLKIEGLSTIKTADMIPATKVIVFQMTKDVVDMVVGQMPTVIPWTSADGFVFHNLIMAILIPRVRSDYNGKSGVVVGTIA